MTWLQLTSVLCDLETTESPDQASSLTFVRDLRNVTKEVGEGLKLKCEVKGEPPALTFRNIF